MATSNDLPPGNVLMGLKSFGHSPDFSEADIQFQMQGNNSLTLRMSQEVLRNTASGLTETLLFLQSHARTTTGHIAVLSLEMVEASVVAAAGGGKILLRLKGTNGIEYYFSLPVALAAQLRPELRQAVQSAEAQTQATRQ
jgi:hypothetical protein